MALSIKATIRNSLLDTYGALFNTGTLKIYKVGNDGVPANADAALGDATLLGTLTFGATAFASADAGSMAANAITQDSAADASGTAAFYRCFKSDSSIIEQGLVSATSGELVLNTVTIVEGGPIQVTSFIRTL